MRIKMKNLVTFLGFAIGLFMVGDLFIFSSVGKHSQRAGSQDTNNPYHVGNVRFLKRQIKSGREYLSEGIKKLYEGEETTPESRDGYDGMRDSLMGAMDVPGIQKKVLPQDHRQGGDGDLFGDQSQLEQLERELMSGTLREEEPPAPPETRLEEMEHDLALQRDDTIPDDHSAPGDSVPDTEAGGGLNFAWSHIFGFGKTPDEKPAVPDDAQPQPSWDGGNMDVPGMDTKYLSKLVNPPQMEEEGPPDTQPSASANDQPGGDAGGSSWGRLFGFGSNSEEAPPSDGADVAAEGGGESLEAPQSSWSVGDVGVPGMDAKYLSKMALSPQEDDLFQMKQANAPPSDLPAPPSEEELENEWLFAQLREVKGLADSVPQWPEEAAPVAPSDAPVASLPGSTPGAPQLKAAYGFFSSLFQPLRFAGSTGDDDKNDDGWASVGELDTFGGLADRVNEAMLPGMQQKLVPQESVLMEQKPTIQVQEAAPPTGAEDFPGPEQQIEMEVIPGFGADFFNKYGQIKASGAAEPEGLPAAADQGPLLPHTDLDVPNVPGLSSDFFNKFFKSANAPEEVAAAVPGIGAAPALPAAQGAEPDQLPNLPVIGDTDAIQVPNVPGLTDDFFNKYHPSNQPALDDGDQGAADAIKVPNIPGLTADFFNKYGANVEAAAEGQAPPDQTFSADALHVPNIPGLTDEFFNKFGVVKPSEQPPVGGVAGVEAPPRYEEDIRYIEVPEVPGISADFFNKFIHPVAAGQAPPDVGMVAESLEDVPGLPPDFFDKFIKDQVPEETVVSGQDLKAQGFDIPDIPGLDEYLDKYMEENDLLPGEGVPVQSLKESLLQAQQQVPGMPDKVIPDGDTGMAPGLPDVPPSGYPEMDDDSAKSGLFNFLMKSGLANLLGSKEPEFGAGLPVLPPGFNLSAPQEGPQEAQEVSVESEIARQLQPRNTSEPGFQMHAPSKDEMDVQRVLKALMPNISSSNDTMALVDARGFLNQLEGVLPGAVGVGGVEAQRPNISEELANITAIEDSRVVTCNITKSPYWKVAITDRWHTVQDGLMFVYSAYMDDRIRGHTAIRILGLLEGWEVGMHLKPFCQVWFQDKSSPFVVGASYEWLPGQPIAKFKAVLLTCVYQTSHVEGKPLAVSLTTEPCDQPKFLVKIHTRNETVGIKKTNFTVCLTGPMKFGYADVGQFIQWMEFNIMMGVERFVLYNHSMDAALRPYLVHYAKLGYVQLFPWIIPDNIPNPLVFLKNLGHLAMINDCLYRNMWTTDYVIFMDIDEMILPRYGHVTFQPMLKNAGCHKKPQAVVQSVFFRREWPNDELFANNQTVVNMGLVGLLKTKRERKIWPPYMRSKYFIKPDEVLICNVHAAHSFLSPLDYQDLSCIFDPKEVVLHHYRYWGEVTGNYVVDRRLHEYGDDLINRAASIYESVLGRKVT